MARSPQAVTARPWAGLFSIAAVFACGAAVARAVAAHHPAAVSIDFAQPLVVVTAWGAYGTLCFAVLAGTVGCATLALVAIVRDSEAFAAPAFAIGLAAALALAALATWPFVFSSDVYAYAAYGSLDRVGIDPYAVLGQYVREPFTDAARWQWGGHTFPACVYGPAFVSLARLVVALTGGTHVAAALTTLRFLACGAFLGCIFALDEALRGVERKRRFRTLAVFGLNPVALWSVAEGHNDAFVLLAALLGFLIVRRGGVLAGALVIGLTPLLKATGVAFVAALALDTLRAPDRTRRLAAGLAVGLAASVTVALPPVLPALATLRRSAHYAPTASLQSALGIVPVAVFATVALAYGVLRLRAHGRDGHAWLGIAVWLALPNPYPWYVLCFLPAVLAAGNGRAALALYGVTISSLVRYLPDASGHIDASGLHLAAAVEALPLFALALPPPRPLPFRKTTPRT
jgi:hypothetical protein